MIDKIYKDYIAEKSIIELYEVSCRIDRNTQEEYFQYVISVLKEKTDEDLSQIPDYKAFSKEELEAKLLEFQNANAPINLALIEEALAEIKPVEPIEPVEEVNRYEKKIKYGWIGGVIYATLILIFFLVSENKDPNLSDNARLILGLADVLLIYGLSYGIYKRSRTAAILMLFQFAVPRIILFMSTGEFNTLLMGIVFFVVFIQATIGIFEYHKIIKEEFEKEIAL